MRFSKHSFLRTYTSAFLSLLIVSSLVWGQQPQKPADEPDVIRISSELVQTGVVVLDKQGRFVDGLKPEQFLLKVDGKPVTPSFFEQVVAGSAREANLESTISRGAAVPPPTPAGRSYLGRNVIFFIDDLHLSKQSLENTRTSINEFVDKQMSVDDTVAVASPSGQIGFLQRFTDLKPVVKAAVGRLAHRPYTVRDYESIKMTEYQALRIEQGDKDATEYFVVELQKANNYRLPAGAGGLGPPAGGPMNNPRAARGEQMQPGLTKEAATRLVNQRASFMMKQSETVTAATLSTLESLMRAATELPGRKLVFFVSDGFFLNDRSTAFGEKMREITDAAVRAGVVVYSLDARGLTSTVDVTSNRADAMGQLARSNIGELAASQDAMNALAVDTGGKAFFNTGRLTDVVNIALNETSNYYLLAWRPETAEQKSQTFKRIEVSIAGRPELTVRMPKGFLVGAPKAAKPTETKPAVADNSPAKATEQAILSTLANTVSKTALPTKLAVSFLDVPNTGPVLTIATQMATDVLGYGADGKQAAAINIGGVILNDQGKQAGGFKARVDVKPSTITTVQNPGVVYNHKVPLKPGIYQIRVAAMDEKSGRIGSAAKWVVIPDLATKKLTMSSLMIGGDFIGSGQTTAGEQMQFSVDHRFLKGGTLNFLSFIYNASAAPTPDLEAQIRISRNGQAVVTSPVQKVAIDPKSDLSRIVYGGSFKLQNLPVGRYLMQVTVTDKVAKTSASEYVTFEVE